MSNPTYQSRASGARPAAINGIVPGGPAHLLLLALRGAGGMTSDQVYARFSSPSVVLHRLKVLGHIEMPDAGQKGKPIRLTAAGREITDASGPLARRKTLITYCQL